MIALILDLDGVICDTAHFHFLAWERLATKISFEMVLPKITGRSTA